MTQRTQKPTIKFPPYLLQRILKPYVRLALNLAFRRIFVLGTSKIPKSGPVLLVGNHQCALIDSLMVHCMMHRRPFFLARADILKKTFIAKLLRQLRMLPIYRIRDGYDQLSKNEAIFEQVAELLNDGKTVAIYPEGNHHHERRIRPLKKGAARILLAHHAIAKEPVTLIPYGIHYEDQYAFRSRVRLAFGDPIPYQDLLVQDQQAFQKSILDRIQKSLKALTIHYELRDQMTEKELLRQQVLNQLDAHWPVKDYFKAEKAHTQELESEQRGNPERFALRIKNLSTIQAIDGQQQRGLMLQKAFQQNLKLGFVRCLLMILLVLAYLFTLPIYGLGSWICQQVALRMTKDSMFFTTVWFATSILIFPILIISTMCLLAAFDLFLPGMLFFGFWTILLLRLDFVFPGFIPNRFPSGEPKLY
ncbi:MAG: lysophospholipid acyltransferase family protein [Bacteroidota bacterium]